MNRPAQLTSGRQTTGASWAPVLARALGLGFLLIVARATGVAEPPAKAYAFTSFSIEAGLPSDVAMSIMQTQDGYLWFGTESGLCRFDGVRFLVYRTATTPELGNNLIRTLYEDELGTLWIGTQGGLSRYRDGRIERVNEIAFPAVGLCGDGAGGVWIATDGGGVYRGRDGRVSAFAGPSLPEKTVAGVFCESNGRLWISFKKSPPLSYDGQALQSLPPLGSEWGGVTRFHEAPRGTLWLGMTKGLARLRDGQLKTFGRAAGLPAEGIASIKSDDQGRLWVVARGLFVAENTEADSFAAVGNPAGDTCRNIFQDREGSYWIGTAGNGVVRMRPSAFRNLPAGGASLNDSVRTITRDREGFLWTGLPGRGLMRVAPDGTATPIDTGAGRDADVWSVYAASDGAVWIGTRGSLFRWREGRLEKFPRPSAVRTIFEDRAGTMWFGPEIDGVLRYRDGQFTAMAGTIGTAESVAMAFAEDGDGALWIGTNEELIRFKDEKTIAYRGGGQIPELAIRSIHPDRDGNLWIGTKRNGLVLFAQGRWFNPNGLREPFSDLVSEVVEDGVGNLWVGTPKGVMWAPKKDFLAIARGGFHEGKFRLVGAADGVRGGAVGYGSQPVSWKVGETLLFATRGGVIAAESGSIRRNEVAPLLRIEKIFVDGQAQPSAPEVTLPPGTRSLSIDYTALSFVQPAAISFRYQLVGYDPNWIEAGTRRTAYYTNLAPGEYRFRMLASNEDGKWNETDAHVVFVQRAWFYETWWFYLGTGSGCAGLAIALYRRRTATLRRDNDRLEHAIADRTHELRTAKEAA